jgi:hypothetical protein
MPFPSAVGVLTLGVLSALGRVGLVDVDPPTPARPDVPLPLLLDEHAAVSITRPTKHESAALTDREGIGPPLATYDTSGELMADCAI